MNLLMKSINTNFKCVTLTDMCTILFQITKVFFSTNKTGILKAIFLLIILLNMFLLRQTSLKFNQKTLLTVAGSTKDK